MVNSAAAALAAPVAPAVSALDLFAGPGGWDEGVAPLGIAPLGVELDAAAVATRHAAGHPTLHADVAALEPSAFAGCDLLIASPPCQAYSVAGKGEGHDDTPYVLAVLDDLAAGRDSRDDARRCCADERSLLVVEPLRFALALTPRWIVLEQVPPVLPIWRYMAALLEGDGWRTWCGVLSSERFGVPQVRQRAILMADRERSPYPPSPTHQAYVYGEPACEQLTIEGLLLPWVSMADALGWTGAVGFPRRADDSLATDDGYRARDFRGAGTPSFAVTATARSWLVNTGRDWKPGGTRDDAQQFTADEQPAPTIDGRGRWFVTPGRHTSTTDENGDRNTYGFSADERPAATVTAGRERWLAWPDERPATTIAGDARVFPPGGHIANDGRDNGAMVGRSEGAIRVELEDAAVLQGFRRDYPFKGTKSQRFQQVGNAVPPPLAHAVVAALLDSTPGGHGNG